MRIEYAIPAKYVEVNDNLATIVGAGVDTFTVSELPAPLSLMLAIRVVGEAREFTGGHRLQCRVRDAQGRLAGEEIDAELEMHPGPENAMRDDWLQNLMLPLAVQFEAAHEGTYTVAIAFDAAELQLPLHLVRMREG